MENSRGYVKVCASFLVTLLLLIGIIAPAAAAGADRYVATTGSDSGDCSVTPCLTIQYAIGQSAAGDTINVAAGTYVETGQIVINKNLSIVGADKTTTIIKPGSDTGGSGDAGAWILVNDGITFNLSKATLDGQGKNIRQGIRYKGSGTVDDVIIQNMVYPGYLGWGIAMGYNSTTAMNLTVSNSTFTNFGRVGILIDEGIGASTATITGNTFTGKGAGDHLDYAIEVEGGAQATITNNTITNCLGVASSDGSTSAGILITTYFAPGTEATITGNIITGNSTGIAVGYDATDTSTVVAHNNDLSGNASGGLTSTAPSVDASSNWWGSTDPATVEAAANGGSLVDYAPFLNSGDADPLTLGFQADLSVLSVDDDSPQTGSVGRIQEAINLADAGGTVNVANGSYIENVVVNKTVTIAGESQAGVIVMPALLNPDCRLGGVGSLCANNASNVFLIEADNVVIHDLTIDGDNPALTSGIVRGGADLDARNGIITNHAVSSYWTGQEVYNVTVRNIYLRGIYNSTIGSFNFHHNTVTNVQGEGASIAIFAWYGPGIMANNHVSYANDGISANHSRGIQFLNNTVTNSGSGIHTDNAGDGGGAADLIQGNTVSNCTSGGYGIWTFVPYLAPTVTENTVTNCDVGLSAWAQGAAVTPIFSKNTVTGSGAAGSVGIYVTTDLISWGYSDISVEFRNNIVTGFDQLLYFTANQQSWNPYPYQAKTITATLYDNSFGGNTNGVYVDTQGTYNIDASGNWWGSNDAAAVKAYVNGGVLVDYTPWLNVGTDTNLITAGFQGDFSTLWVDDDSPQTGATGRVQEGVDRVSGSTVYLAAGTYMEQVEITKDLTLQGAGSSTIIQSPDILTKYFTTGANNNKPIVYIHNANAVTIQDLVVDGLGKGNANYRFIGIAYYNAGGIVDNVEVRNITNTPFSGAQHGVAIYANNADAAQRTLEVMNSNLHDFQKNGMALIGTGLTVDVHHNIVTGIGATGITAQNGIQISGANGDVYENNVSNISWTGPTWTSSGILVYGPGTVNTTDNTLSEVQASIYYWDASGTIEGNDISATQSGTGASAYYGILAGDPLDKLPSPLDQVTGQAAPAVTLGPTAVLTIDITDNTITGGSDNVNSIGIQAFAGYSADTPNTSITGNAIEGWGYGVVLDQCTSDCSGTSFGSLSVNFNGFLGNTIGLGAYGLATPPDAEYNWWGCTAGPDQTGCDTTEGSPDTSPWLGNWPNVPGNNTYYVAAGYDDGADVNDLISTIAISGDTIVLMPGLHTPSGGYLVNTAGLTFIATGATIQPASPCFTISADNTFLFGGVCTPTSGSDGFVTGAAVDGLVIQDWEITSSAGGDGIHLAYNVTNLQVVDNFIHDLGGDGLEYAAGIAVTGVHEIQGNLFQNNTGYGINNASSNTYDVRYNSWGDIDGPTGTNGDGYSGLLTYDPWTHAKLSLLSSGTPTANKVGLGGQITYEIKLEAWKLAGADFDMAFDETRLSVVSITNSGLFTQSTGCTLSTPAQANATGLISFCGNRTTALDNPNATVFTVVFQGIAAGISGLDFDEAGDTFAMLAQSASSNVYAAGLVDSPIEVLDVHNAGGRIDLQGRANDSGVVVRLFGLLGYNYTGTTNYWGAFSLTGIFDDTYNITVSMARYLDVTLASAKSVIINAGKLVINTLTLLGGDLDNDDQIELSDAVIVGGQYGTAGPEADINNDGIVNLLDLVMVGSNYGQSSDHAYDSWIP